MSVQRKIALFTVLAMLLAGLAATVVLAATKTVAVKDNHFGTKSLTIRKGTTVKWVWRGRNIHNVTVTSGPSKFRSGTKTSGTFKHRFTRKGLYRIVCTIHAPGMKMTVRVK
jgi:plastocyanin